MQVYKFGGASVKDAAGIRNVADILKRSNGTVLVVVSAMGKTTNALELIVKENDQDLAAQSWEAVFNSHLDIAKELEAELYCGKYLKEYLAEGKSIIYDYSRSNSDEFYDQIISLGELMSTTLVVGYLLSIGEKANWLDARKLIRSDEHFRSGNIQWRETEMAINSSVEKHRDQSKFLVTQGFIASTRDGRTTTLGREGSDYTAAILSYCINATNMTVWKDVPGVLTGDPRIFPNANLIPKMSYQEAIEMTYYGAQIIHPKTIQPIQRKGIPLQVKSFIQLDNEGTTIDEIGEESYPPMTVVTMNQYLMKFSTKDFSFVAERHLSMLFRKFNHFRIRVNLMRNSAISFTVCLSAEKDRLQYLKEELQYEFDIEEKTGLELITIRHFTEPKIIALQKGRKVLFEEKHDVTYQMVVE